MDQDTRGLEKKPGKSGGKSPAAGSQYLLGIGINEYQGFPQLNNAVKDIRDITGLLVGKYGFNPDNAIQLFDKEAIEENIIDAFDHLARTLKEEDRLVIYYSGHGHLDPVTNLGYWIPHDAKPDKTSRYIRNSTVRDYIKVIKARHILLISDSCFSGSLFVRGAHRSSGSAFAELDKIPSRWAICSGRHDEQVFDGEPGGNSPFTESILDILGGNENSFLNVAKIADRVVEQTRSNYEQLPEGNPLYGVGHKGGQFIFRLDGESIQRESREKVIERSDPIEEKQPVIKVRDVTKPEEREDIPDPDPGPGPGNLKKYLAIAAGVLLLGLAGTWIVPALKSGKSGKASNLKSFMDRRTRKFGFQDQKGNIMIKAVYDQVNEFQNNVAKVSQGSYTFYINEQGKCLRNCPPANATNESEEIQAKRAWEAAYNQNTVAAYKMFLEKYGNSAYAKRAEDKLKELSAQGDPDDLALWQKTIKINTLRAYEYYLRKYPNGKYARTASSRIRTLREKQ